MRTLVGVAAVVALPAYMVQPAWAVPSVTVISFDDRPGRPPVFGEGCPVDPQYIVSDQYLPLGVLLDSAGGGIVICAPSNPVSSPNVASATRLGPKVTFLEPVDASFWLGGYSAVVDSVSVTLTSSSQLRRLEAFDVYGSLLGSNQGGAAATLTVAYSGLIHSVRIQQGPMAFDDFTFV